MANKLTRKGLAGAVALALVTVGLSAAPASANSVTLAVEAGTGTTGILGDSFFVKASLGSNLTSTANTRLKFAVTNSTGAVLTYVADNTPSADARSSYSGTTTRDGSAATNSTGTADVVYDANTSSPQSQSVLGISSAATAAHSVTVVAFVDDNLNDINDDAFVSSAVTINFVTLANAGLSLALTAPQPGETALSATLTSSVVNVAQLDAADYGVEFGFFNSGTATTLSSSSVAWGSVTNLNTTTSLSLVTPARTSLTGSDTSLENHGSPSNGSIKAELTYIAQLWTNQSGSVAKLGAVVSSAVAKATVAQAESEAYWVESANVTPAGVIRTGTTSATLEVFVANARGVALANKVVILTTGSVVGTHTINGVSAASSSAYRATTNASGIATFAVVSSTAATNNTIPVASVTSDGVSISGAGNAVWTAVVYRVVQEIQTATTDVQRFAATGGTYTANMVVLDNWNQKLAASDFRVKYELTGRSVATAFDSLSDGVASVAIADGSVGSTASTTAAFSLEKLTGGTWAAHTDSAVVDMTGSAGASGENDALVINWATATPVITLNADGTSSADLSVYAGLSTARAGNTITSHYSETSISTSTPDASALITGTVRTNLGANMTGGLVTVSGDSSILFRVGTASGLGSLSFHTADGSLSITAYSNKIQTNSVVTVTVGSVSSTVRLSFLGSRTDVGTSVVIDAPSAVEPGSTLQAIVKVVDRFGNGIDTDITATDFNGSGTAVKADGEDDADFRLTVTGPGISLTTLPTGTTNGSAIVNRLLGSKDSGTIVITATYGGADAVIGTGDDDITVTKSITVGALPPAPITGKVNVGSFNGKLVVYAQNLDGKRISWKVGGNWGKATAVGNSLNRFDRPTPRRGVTVSVQIYVDGVLQLTKSVVTR